MNVHSTGQAVCCLVALALALGAGAARAADPRLRAELEAVARRTVLFGHQSVGTDILDGLRDLSAEEGVPLRILEVTSARGAAPGTCAHVFVAENGKPELKLQSFERALEGAAGVDVALLKFCFVDLLEGHDAEALFRRYQAALRALAARHPRVTFVRATLPLTAVPTGPKAFLKRLLGRDRPHLEDNARREQFNALVRTAWQGPEPLFDVARIESTRPDGTVESGELGGRQVPALVPAYTHDGGHLNPTGRRLVARELVRLLAQVPARDVAATQGASR